MARIRTIKPEFWESESVGRLSFGARLLFIASLNLADDEGLIRWNEAFLSSQAFVYDELSTEQISEWMSELVSEGIIFPYKAGTTNQRLAWIVSFRNHQVINRPQPSKLPPPSVQNPEFHKAISTRDRHICHLCSTPIAEYGNVNESGSLLGSLDHVIPKSNGGNDYPSNLKAAHISCNKSRKNNPIKEPSGKCMNESVNESVVEGKGKGREGIDTLSGEDPTPIPETTKLKPFNTEANEVLEYLNEKAGSHFKPVDSNVKLITARMKDGATLVEIKLVIDAKVAEWISDVKMHKYMRPSTLFNATKYAQYAGQLEQVDSGKGEWFEFLSKFECDLTPQEKAQLFVARSATR